ncbi:MAG: molybdenum cofactor guanylyltransferase [Aridibacter sp.]
MFDEFSGYILAGGKSSRMGSDKAFLKIGDKNFVENAVEILQPICENRLKIVLNSKQNYFIEKLPENIPHIFDIYKTRGALGGIHASLKDCKTKYAVILAVDLPCVSSEAIIKLCKITFDLQQISAVIPIQNNSKLQPLCGVYERNACLPKLEVLLTENNSISVHQFLELIDFITVDQTKLQDNSNSFLNVNSPADYEQIILNKKMIKSKIDKNL